MSKSPEVKPKDLQRYQRLFLDHDLRRNGLIPKAEVLNALDELGYPLTKDKLVQFYNSIGIDKPRELNEQEFTTLLSTVVRESKVLEQKALAASRAQTKAKVQQHSSVHALMSPAKHSKSEDLFKSKVENVKKQSNASNEPLNLQSLLQQQQISLDQSEHPNWISDVESCISKVGSESSDYHYFDENEDMLFLDFDESNPMLPLAASGDILGSVEKLAIEVPNVPVNEQEVKIAVENPDNKKFKARREMQKEIPNVLYDPKVRKQLLKQRKSKPFFTALSLIVCIVILVIEIIVSGGFDNISNNPLIGPKATVMISLGGRYVPCMRRDPTIPPGSRVQCPSGYTGNASLASNPNLCDYYKYLNELCGMGGISNSNPNQWWRYFTALYLHAGIVHILFNGLMLWRNGFPLEEQVGTLRMMIIYIVSGVGGNLFSAIMEPKTVTVGASTSLYGLFALMVLDLIHNWPLIVEPKKNLAILLVQIIISLGIGLLPEIDNFAHVGGFITGLLCGNIFIPKIYFSSADRIRKYCITAGCLVLLVGMIAFGFSAFYENVSGSEFCTWCSWVDCIPGSSWCSTK